MALQDGGGDRINIAIDGPAGAGKSTVARKVAEQLGYVYIDTGAMYRAVTLIALRLSITAKQEAELAGLLKSLQIRLEPGENGQSIFMNDEDVTIQIRSLEVTRQVSYFAASSVVREVLSEMQRELAVRKGVVMDGRDIGTHVLPGAELKIYLTASVRERALRRFKELPVDNAMSLEQLENEIAERDRLDEQRDISPLICAKDAIELDSSHLSIDEVVAAILKLSRTKLAEAK